MTLEYEGKEKYILKNQRVEYDSQSNLLLAPLIERVKEQGFEAKGHVITYYSVSDHAFVFVNKDPIPSDFSVSLDEIDITKPLHIKLRPTSESPAI